MKIGKAKVVALVMMLAVGLTACGKQQTGESVGNGIDQAANSAGKSIAQATQNLDDQTAKAGAMVEDMAITTKIKNAIMAEPGLKVLNIHVDTLNGAVILTGIVRSKDRSDLAKKIASSVPEVKSVDNQLIVRADS